MIFWFTPVMSASHLLFSIGCTVYILVAIQWEEKDLVDSLGAEYQRYKNEVPMLVPRVGRDTRKSDSELSSI
jgi:protein-S-isoprenylcysteine O-methyltransferase Ste14